MKMTLAQHCALVDISEAPSSASRMGASMATLWALNKKGLARPHGGPGSIAFPRSMQWSITDAGRAALAARKEEGRP